MKHSVQTAALVAMLLTGCATNRATISSHIDPGHQPGTIQSVAVFPIRNARLAPAESEQINRKISQAVVRSKPEIRIMSPSEAQRRINEANLASEWAQFLEDYISSGVPNSAQLRKIGDAMEVDAIIQGEVVNVFQQDGRFGSHAATTRVTVRLTMLDTNRGGVTWQAQSDGLRETATTVAQAPPIVEAIELALNRLLGSFPQL